MPSQTENAASVVSSLPPDVIAALVAYESSVQAALRIAPTHWQRYRDPFELGIEMRKAREFGRAAMEEVERVIAS